MSIIVVVVVIEILKPQKGFLRKNGRVSAEDWPKHTRKSSTFLTWFVSEKKSLEVSLDCKSGVFLLLRLTKQILKGSEAAHSEIYPIKVN